MSNIVYIATSMDGFVARKDGNIDWLTEMPNPGNSDYGYADFMNRIDGILLGRVTFQSAIAFDKWPYSKPVFVLSNSLAEAPADLRGKAEVVNGDLKEIITTLKRRGINNLYIDGARTIQSFLKKDLIDEITMTRIPIVLGSGIPLFDSIGMELRFEHVQTDIYDNMLVKSRYIRSR